MEILQNNFIKISSIKKNNILEIFKNNDYINIVANDDNDIPISISLLNNNEDILSIDRIIIFFHGAVDQKVRNLPVFEGRFSKDDFNSNSLVFSIADPSLRLNQELTSCWYTGDLFIKTPKLINLFIDHIKSFFNNFRLVFAGGSSGAFPALRHSFEHKDSIAVVYNPITNILKYFEKPKKSYFKYCWNDNQVNNINDTILDLTSLYSNNLNNFVIYLQNASDYHLYHDAIPFLKNIKNFNRCYPVIEVFDGFWGHLYPPHVWIRWIYAATYSSEISFKEISKNFYNKKEGNFRQMLEVTDKFLGL